MAPSLDQVLELAREARRSPNARRVLHDALLERYGASYQFAIDEAGKQAASRKRPFIVMLVPEALVSAESTPYKRKEWRSADGVGLLTYWYHAFRIHDLTGPGPRRSASHVAMQQVVTVRPR